METTQIAAPTEVHAEIQVDQVEQTNQIAPTPEEMQAIVVELEAYRQRIIDDMMALGKRFKLPKSTVMERLETHPEILEIDQHLSQLREQLG
jgi:cell division septal protein FtsQ